MHNRFSVSHLFLSFCTSAVLISSGMGFYPPGQFDLPCFGLGLITAVLSVIDLLRAVGALKESSIMYRGRPALNKIAGAFFFGSGSMLLAATIIFAPWPKLAMNVSFGVVSVVAAVTCAMILLFDKDGRLA